METQTIDCPALRAKAKSPLDTTLKTVDLIWSIIKLGVLIVLVIGLLMWKFSTPREDELGMTKFIAMASPLETSTQVFSIGNHKMPKVEVMAPLAEAERIANPAMTAAQLQRAKWMDRTWNEVRLRNESNKTLSNSSKGLVNEYVTGIISDAMDKKAQVSKGMDTESAVAEVSNLNVLVGKDVIPSLASGLLPVFTDAETTAWKAELARQKITLNELDMRRAKFFQAKFGVGTMPAKAPADIELRTAEKLEPGVSNGWSLVRPQSAPLSDNERLELACQALNYVANPASIPAAPEPAAAAPRHQVPGCSMCGPRKIPGF